MVDIVTVYYLVEILVGLVIIAGVVWGSFHWLGKHKPESVKASDTIKNVLTVDGGIKVPKLQKGKKEEQIACSECQTVFTPKWKERELASGEIIDVAVCPHCGEDNEFEVVEDEDDEEDEDEE